MKLKLKNFRCYQEREFDFGDDGLVLLSGPSGSGKSTLLMAIFFVLYGTLQKVITFGKTSCEVCMTFDDLIITRSKKPNRLTVLNSNTNEEYEDDVAQGIINERFGTAFNITSYIQQNASESFIMMKPTDKLAFLEQFAFTGVDLGKLKARCNATIKKRNEELIATTSQLEMATEQLKTLTKPDKIAFPRIPITAKGREHAIKNEEIRAKNNKILIKKAEKELDALKRELADLRVFNATKSGKEENCATLEEKIGAITLEKDTTHYEGDEQLQNYEDVLAVLVAQRELIVLQERYEQDKSRLELMCNSEREKIQHSIENIKKVLWSEYTEVGVNELISERTVMLKDVEQVQRLQKLLEKYEGVSETKLEENKKKLSDAREKLETKKELLSKLLLQKELYECPNCNASLRLEDSKLIESDVVLDSSEDIETVENDISNLNRIVSKLEYSIPEEQNKLKRFVETQTELNAIKDRYETELLTRNEVEDDIEHLKEYKRSQHEQERIKKKLESDLKDKIYSGSIETFKTQLAKQKDAIKTLETKLKAVKMSKSIDEEELRTTIVAQRQNKEKLSAYDKQLRVLNKELKIHTDAIAELVSNHNSKYTSVKELDTLEHTVKEQEETLLSLKKEEVLREQNLKAIQDYLNYKKELDTYNEWQKKISTLEESEKKVRQQYSAGMIVKDKILEAESIAMTNIINSINTHAQEYLDLFFPDSPIVVRLLPFKQTKKKSVSGSVKPQINLEVDYKGMEADLDMLSGGEIARVILAYCLSLAEIFNSPFLMLDESTASLDQELNSVVLEGIQKNFADKLVIVIAHQVVEGHFDRQILL